MLKLTALPDTPRGVDVHSAKAWYSALARHGALWHPDDPPQTIEDTRGRRIFDEPAAAAVADVVVAFSAGSVRWPDPNFLYDLAAVGHFTVEDEFPGFEIDRCIPGAGRTGYVTVPGQTVPTIAIEEGGQFFAVRVFPSTGRLSEAAAFEIVPLVGASFSRDGMMDVSRATPDVGRAVRVEHIDWIDAALKTLLGEHRGGAWSPGR